MLLITALAVTSPPTAVLRNGIKMPMLAAGVWEYNASEAYASISSALAAGFTSIDTALDYCGKRARLPRSTRARLPAGCHVWVCDFKAGRYPVPGMLEATRERLPHKYDFGRMHVLAGGSW